MRYFYFPELPLMTAPIPGLEGPNDPRLSQILEEPPIGFGHKIRENSWSTRTGKDIIETIREEGQNYPNICHKDSNDQWIVEPGQTRWLAIYHLGLPHQKVVVCVRDHELDEFEERFGAYTHSEITELSLYLSSEDLETVLGRSEL